MMAAALHSNVGLMHAPMAIFNAWCDRAPVLILGATGPWDAAQRRPWIDWIHTCSDQGALIRNYTKWDNQPGSVRAAAEALLRAAQIAQTAPRGPVYINLDVAMQEGSSDALPPLPDVARFRAPQPVVPARELVAEAARLLVEREEPGDPVRALLAQHRGWKARVALAEKLNAPVLTNIKIGGGIPDRSSAARGAGRSTCRRRREAVARGRRDPRRSTGSTSPARSSRRAATSR